jgi:hypothetical protein
MGENPMQDNPPKRAGMVDWYAPIELTQTGLRALASTALGAMIDTRTILSIKANAEDCVFDYSTDSSGQQRETFTFDYTADTGDGFNSTYSMAYLFTSDELDIKGQDSNLKRSELVILGGDEVYPVASKEAYFHRLISPFKEAAKNLRAAKSEDGHRARLAWKDLFMIPGNHDWYDGLGSMSRRFFSYWTPSTVKKNAFGQQRKPRKLGQFYTHQPQGYFVIVLPHNWEIWAVDIQLGNDIDPDQFAFFSWRSESLSADSKVIICSAIPTIVYGKDRDQGPLTFGLNRISGLVRGKGARTCAQFAGDVHNYQRYEVPKTSKHEINYTRQHVVCGGGGAFLHPNHSFHKDDGISERKEPVMRYPSRDQSKTLSRRILLFPFKHVGMCVLIGLLYLMMFWQEGPPGFSVSELSNYAVNHPTTLALLAVALLGCMGFAKKKRTWGLLHGAVHVAAAVLSWKAGGAAAQWLANIPWLQGLEPITWRAATFLVGGALGGTIFGAYLFASLNWFRIHRNEAFSSLSWPHYKSFLRCEVEKDGSLTVNVIGVDRTAAENESHPVKTHLVERFSME